MFGFFRGTALNKIKMPGKTSDSNTKTRVSPDEWDAKALRRMSRGSWYGGPQDSDEEEEGSQMEGVALAQTMIARSSGSGGRMLCGALGGMAPRMAPPPPMPCAAAPMMMAYGAPAGAMAPPAGGTAIGFKTGGAQDATNFRENIAAGHLPALTDVTYEGVIKDYFFDTTSSYSLALAPDPLVVSAAGRGGGEPATQQQDVFLAVGLDSGITDFKRPRLNLNILLDVSGSMDCSFDQYYYSPQGRQQLTGEDARKTKLDVSKEVIKGMLAKLAPDDAVSISLFSDSAASPKHMGKLGSADLAGIKAGIDSLRTIGGTNFQAGLDESSAQLRGWGDCVDGDPAETENRIIVLTDAETNTGDISEEGLMSRLKALAADRIYVTIVGVGMDFNTQLVEAITKTKGANYFSVHTPGEFKKRLEDEFDFMVAPLVFDLELRVDPSSLAPSPPQGAEDEADWVAVPAPSGWKILHVYGSPETEQRKLSGGGSVMRIPSLFPAAKTEEGIKGGVVLLRMLPPAGTSATTAPPLKLSVKYADRSGNQFDTQRAVEVSAAAAAALAEQGAFYQSSGVHKAVVLARLVDALQCWLVDAWADVRGGSGRSAADGWNAGVVAGLWQPAPVPRPTPLPCVPPPAGGQDQAGPARHLLRPGCPLLPPGRRAEAQALPKLGRWERTSEPLAVGPQARAALAQLLPWLEAEVAALGDGEMKQEVDLVRKLLVSAGTS